MEKSQKFLDPQMLAKLNGLQLRARHIAEGFVAGLHRSPYRGFSIEFAEHREYTPGDDLRYLDWKVFGRTDKLYLKQYEDETNLICHLVLDVSESMTYQGPQAALSKLEYAQCLAVAIAWLVLNQQDAVGLSTFDEKLQAQIRPSSQASHLQNIIQAIEATESHSKTSLARTFHELAGCLTKRGVVIVLSDLFDDVPTLLKGLRHFGHMRHDVVVMHIMDPAELEFPFARPTLFRGLEQFPEIAADPSSLRKAYIEEIERFQQEIESGCAKMGVDYQLVNTQRPLDVVLSHYLAQRERRMI